MAAVSRQLVNPILFSQHFSGTAPKLAAAGLFDPVLNSDSKLFIDPLLLQGSDNSHMAEAHKLDTRKNRLISGGTVGSARFRDDAGPQAA